MKKFIQLGDYQAAYTVQGQGESLILLHGFFGDASTLEPLVKELSSNFQCFNLELLGFGDSAKPKINYLIHDQVDFLKSFIDSLGLNKTYLLGYSYGAWVASAYAIQHQTDLKKLGLVAPAGIRDDSFVGRYDHLKPLLWQTKLVDWAIALYRPYLSWQGKEAEYQKIAEARHALMTQPAAAAMLKSRLKPTDAVDTVEQEIHQISLETMVIAAENDTTIPHWHSETYVQKIKTAQLKVIADADHDFVQTHPQEISEIIKTFFT
jgi:pimeloyl-ACP methyl ester carboxylesterase